MSNLEGPECPNVGVAKAKKKLRQRESVLAGISTTSSRIESATPAATAATVQILSRLSLQSSLSLEIGYIFR